MRLIAQHGRYAIQYRKKTAQVDINGVETVVQEPIYLSFEKNDIYENERDAANERFAFKGQFQHQDEATPLDPLYRISTFDTRKQGWPDELREEIEAFLRAKALHSEAFFIIETTPIPAPFPAFDAWEGTPSALVEKLAEDGHDLAEVLAYERLFGGNRTPVVKALEKATAPDETVVTA